jgi:hypothetical protein
MPKITGAAKCQLYRNSLVYAENIGLNDGLMRLSRHW